MNEQKTYTRGEFLSIIGGMAAVAFLSKFIDSKKALSTVLGPHAHLTSAYGNHNYGGKRA